MRDDHFVARWICVCFMIALIGCSGNSYKPVALADGKVETSRKNGLISETAAAVTKKWIKGWSVCRPPKHNCIDVIVVTAPKVIQLANLDNAIANSTLTASFASSSNYNAIWTAIPPTILSDLQSGATKMDKVPDSDSVYVWYGFMDLSGNPVDYSTVP